MNHENAIIVRPPKGKEYIIKKIEELADKDGRSTSNYVFRILEQFIKKQKK